MVTLVENGGVTSARGFSAGGVFAGIKTPGPDKLDIGLLYSELPCTVAGTYTRNSVVSPSVTLTRQLAGAGKPVHGVVANSGCANCAVGEQGLIDAKETVRIAAEKLGVESDQVLIASTGVIGVELPMALIREWVPRIQLSSWAGDEFARAIMTTDTHAKQTAAKVEADGATITVGGCAKGAGMIHPNMATMLAFITTDAAVERSFLQQTLSDAVAGSFNQIDVDGDQSTNDTVLLLANGSADSRELSGGDAASDSFAEAVWEVCKRLARELARDGEGARRLIEVTVEGAHSDEDAARAARSVASSLLVRTAVYGQDPNWGRILMAVGKTHIPLDESRIKVFVNDIQIVEGGRAIPFNVQAVVASLGEAEVRLRVDLDVGSGAGQAWSCDLTEEYVVFNSAYTT